MGGIKATIKAGADSALGQLKSMNIDNTINTKLNAAGLNVKIPEINLPDVSDVKLNTEGIKVPDANKITGPVKEKVGSIISDISLPSEIGGFELPKIPDMSELTAKANDYISDTGFSLKEGITFDDVKKLVSRGDINSVLDFNFNSPIDMRSIEAVNAGTITSLDTFDLSETQSQIDALTSEMGMESIDISKYF